MQILLNSVKFPSFPFINDATKNTKVQLLINFSYAITKGRGFHPPKLINIATKNSQVREGLSLTHCLAMHC